MGVKWDKVRSDLRAVWRFILFVAIMAAIIFLVLEYQGVIDYIPSIVEKVMMWFGYIVIYILGFAMALVMAKDRYWESEDGGHE